MVFEDLDQACQCCRPSAAHMDQLGHIKGQASCIARIQMAGTCEHENQRLPSCGTAQAKGQAAHIHRAVEEKNQMDTEDTHYYTSGGTAAGVRVPVGRFRCMDQLRGRAAPAAPRVLFGDDAAAQQGAGRGHGDLGCQGCGRAPDQEGVPSAGNADDDGVCVPGVSGVGEDGRGQAAAAPGLRRGKGTGALWAVVDGDGVLGEDGAR